MTLFVSPRQTEPNLNGIIAAGWTYYFYEPGTTTPKTVYSDSALTTALGTSVESVANGRFPAIFYDGAVKVVLKDADGVEQWTEDNYNPSFNPVTLPALATLLVSSSVDGVHRVINNYYRDAILKCDLKYQYSASTAKSEHNGITVLSPTVPWDGLSGASHDAFIAGEGETDAGGVGAWILQNTGPVTGEMLGVIPNSTYPASAPMNAFGQLTDKMTLTLQEGTFLAENVDFNGKVVVGAGRLNTIIKAVDAATYSPIVTTKDATWLRDLTVKVEDQNLAPIHITGPRSTTLKNIKLLNVRIDQLGSTAWGHGIYIDAVPEDWEFSRILCDTPDRDDWDEVAPLLGDVGAPSQIFYNAELTHDEASNGGTGYRAVVTHTSDADTEPGVGVDWETVWTTRGSASAAAWQLATEYFSNPDRPEYTWGITKSGFNGGCGVLRAKADAESFNGLSFSYNVCRNSRNNPLFLYHAASFEVTHNLFYQCEAVKTSTHGNGVIWLDTYGTRNEVGIVRNTFNCNFNTFYQCIGNAIYSEECYGFNIMGNIFVEQQVYSDGTFFTATVYDDSISANVTTVDYGGNGIVLTGGTRNASVAFNQFFGCEGRSIVVNRFLGVHWERAISNISLTHNNHVDCRSDAILLREDSSGIRLDSELVENAGFERVNTYTLTVDAGAAAPDSVGFTAKISGETVAFSYTLTGGDTATDAATALVADVEADGDIGALVAVVDNEDGSFTISQVDGAENLNIYALTDIAIDTSDLRAMVRIDQTNTQLDISRLSVKNCVLGFPETAGDLFYCHGIYMTYNINGRGNLIGNEIRTRGDTTTLIKMAGMRGKIDNNDLTVSGTDGGRTVTQALDISTTTSNPTAFGLNTGYQSQAMGTVTWETSATQSFTVAHRLDNGTPQVVLANTNLAGVDVKITSIDSTNITFRVEDSTDGSKPSSDVTIYWQAFRNSMTRYTDSVTT